MKAKIIISIICACSLFYVQAQEEWEYVCSLTGESLRKVYAQGTDIVYVVGENGLIAKSTNKGLTWDKKYFSNGEALNDIIFCTDDIGFIVGNNGTILKTQNAGLSWEQMASGTVLNINAIAVFDLNNIWTIGSTWDMQAMRYSSLIMYSTDMGETWNTKPLLPNNLYLSDIKSKGSRGYITGDGGVVLKTEDSGMTWEEQILTEYYGIRSLSITDNKVYALGDDNIIFTEDNVNWQNLNASLSPRGKLAVYFQDDQNGFISSYDIPTCCAPASLWIEKTTDGGNMWEYVYDDGFTLNKYYDRSNFSFSSDNEFGYCVLRSHLVRTPYTGEFQYCRNYSEIGVIKSENPMLILSQKGNELQIDSHSKTMDKVEFITINGIKIIQRTEQTKALNINVSNLSKGIYLINILFSDKTSYSVKWIKNN